MSKILLISDIHFGKDARTPEFVLDGQKVSGLQGTDDLEYFDSFIKMVKNANLDYIICAGDLTSEGKPLEFKACLEKIYYLAEQVGIPFENVIYCVGNHDVDEELTSLIFDNKQWKALKKEFDSLSHDDKKYLKSYYCGISQAWLQHYNPVSSDKTYNLVFDHLGPIPMSGYIKRNGINFFVLNSAFMRTSDQKVNHGILGRKQLDWLKKTLKEKSKSGEWNIVLLHHHPFAYKYPEIFHEVATLEEGPDLQAVCSEYPGTIVIHGHCHYPMATTKNETGWKNHVTFISAGSFSINSDGRFLNKVENTYHIIELEEYPDLIKLETYSFSNQSSWGKIPEDEYNVIGPLRYLGQAPLGDTDISDLLSMLPRNQVIKYADLDKRIKYKTIKDLNAMLISMYGKNLSGSFPNDIYIHGS